MMRAISLFACGVLFAVCLGATFKDYSAEVLTCHNISRHGWRFVRGRCQDAPGGGIWVHGSITTGIVTEPATVLESMPR